MRRCLQRAMINPKTDESNRLRGFEPETKTMFANKDWFGERCDPRDASGWIEHGIDGANLISRLLIEPLLRLIQEKNLKKNLEEQRKESLVPKKERELYHWIFFFSKSNFATHTRKYTFLDDRRQSRTRIGESTWGSLVNALYSLNALNLAIKIQSTTTPTPTEA